MLVAGHKGPNPDLIFQREWYASNMNQAATRADIDEVIEIMKGFMGQVSDQFVSINKRLDSLDQKYDHLISTIDGFLSRIDKYETELAARDNQFEKLVVWARRESLAKTIM
jgi:hypothetical protein